MAKTEKQLREQQPRTEEERLLREELQIANDNYGLLQERLVELELALEDEGWRRLGLEGERDFSREGLKRIVSMSRIMFLKNPLIQRGVEIRSFYVWGQGVQIKAENEDVNTLVHEFLDDVGNRREFTSHAARVKKEVKLQTEGNVFFVMFVNRLNGKCKVRTLPFDEIEDTVTNPQDRREVWFYKRVWTEAQFNVTTGETKFVQRKAMYPDMHFNFSANKDFKDRPDKIGEWEMRWNEPVYHVSVGALDDMRFGVPETYAALDWARAYKNFLEDWASIARALSRFAWRATAPKGKHKIVRDKLHLSIDRGEGTEVSSNGSGPPIAGSAFVGSEGYDLTPISKSGATTSAEDGRMLRLMVASALHLPDTILSNDPQQGALATAKTLDRPTELAMIDRQTLWADVLRDLLGFVVLQAIKAVNNRIPGAQVIADDEGVEHIVFRNDSETDMTITVEFPPILEDDPVARIDAIIKAFTIDGKTLADVAPKDVFRRLVLTVLGLDDVDEIVQEMSDLDEEEATAPEEPNLPAEAVEALVATLREVKAEMEAHRV